jgi:hypothetical protein
MNLSTKEHDTLKSWAHGSGKAVTWHCSGAVTLHAFAKSAHLQACFDSPAVAVAAIRSLSAIPWVSVEPCDFEKAERLAAARRGGRQRWAGR